MYLVESHELVEPVAEDCVFELVVFLTELAGGLVLEAVVFVALLCRLEELAVLGVSRRGLD